METKEKFYGFVVYKIVENGLLSGLFVNNYPNNKGKTMNEIARIKSDKSDDEISGIYTNAWIEVEKNEGILGTLIIKPSGNDTYSLEWVGIGMEGTGMKIGPKQLVAIYWKKDESICFGENIK